MPITFSGGDALEAKLLEIANRVSEPGVLRVGFLEGATYPDGTPVPLVAAINEYGTATQPARPFFRQMIASKSARWGVKLGRILAANGYRGQQSLMLMGEGIRSQLQESIRTFKGAPLAQSTVDAKGFDKALIDTSVMINAVDYEVSDE